VGGASRGVGEGRQAEGDHASEEAAPESMRRDVYVYFDNDAKVRAPVDAQTLMERVKRLLG
jgi:uncharacterized protein YecE (DUF72 family)